MLIAMWDIAPFVTDSRRRRFRYLFERSFTGDPKEIEERYGRLFRHIRKHWRIADAADSGKDEMRLYLRKKAVLIGLGRDGIFARVRADRARCCEINPEYYM